MYITEFLNTALITRDPCLRQLGVLSVEYTALYGYNYCNNVMSKILTLS